MNKKRLEILADAVLNNPEHFDMKEGILIDGADVYGKDIQIPYFDKREGKSTFIRGCNTTCCFAGMAVFLFSEENKKHYDTWSNMFEEAQELLGLTKKKASELFDVPLSSTTFLACDKESFCSNVIYAKAGHKRIHDLISVWEKEKEEDKLK